MYGKHVGTPYSYAIRRSIDESSYSSRRTRCRLDPFRNVEAKANIAGSEIKGLSGE
jgi:hypothetical protein